MSVGILLVTHGKLGHYLLGTMADMIGPLPLQGAYVLGALSGYGVMASQAAAELLAAHMVGDRLPDYAPAFLPSRYDDPEYRRRLESMDSKTGQL